MTKEVVLPVSPLEVIMVVSIVAQWIIWCRSGVEEYVVTGMATMFCLLGGVHICTHVNTNN